MYGNENINHNVYYINIFFTVFFAFEAVMKIIVLTPPVSLLPALICLLSSIFTQFILSLMSTHLSFYSNFCCNL